MGFATTVGGVFRSRKASQKGKIVENDKKETRTTTTGEKSTFRQGKLSRVTKE